MKKVFPVEVREHGASATHRAIAILLSIENFVLAGSDDYSQYPMSPSHSQTVATAGRISDTSTHCVG